MSWVAARIARNVWAAMLWLMRRRWVRRLQRASIRVFAEGPRRERAWQRFRRQERFARKHGLRILTAVVTVCLYSLALLLMYQILGNALEEGWFALPSQPREG